MREDPPEAEEEGVTVPGGRDTATRWRTRFGAHLLRLGKVVAYPTEAVYGLGCDPLDAAAVMRILAMKRRPASKGLILVAADPGQLDPYARPSAEELRRALGTWPGPVTWIVTARPGLPAWLSGGRPRVAVRVSAHPLVSELCRAFGGPIVSTSANRADRPPERRALGVRMRFGAEVDWILPGEVGGAERPSAILDAETGSAVRAG